MPRHKLYGRVVQSDLVFRDLLSVGQEGEFFLKVEQRSGLIVDGSYYTWRNGDGTIWLQFTKHGSDYCLTFPDLAQFIISADGRQITCYPERAIPDSTLRHLFLDHVLPLALSHSGELALHASAVEVRGTCLGFLGVSGKGKSTLALYLAGNGFPLLTDDCLLIRGEPPCIMGIPSYPSCRLWPGDLPTLPCAGLKVSDVAHYTSKKRVSLNGAIPFCQSPAPVSALWFLASREPAGDDSPVVASRLAPREAMMELISHSFQLDVLDKQRLKRHFEQVGQLARSVPVFRLSYPRDRSLLPKIMETVLAHSAAFRTPSHVIPCPLMHRTSDAPPSGSQFAMF